MNKISIIAENTESTVVTEYEPLFRKETGYQSEAELEKSFIERLKEQAYEYVEIRNEKDLINNLRLQLEKLNDIKFSDKDWNEFFTNNIANRNLNIEGKTKVIQEDYIKHFTFENGRMDNIR